MKILKNAHVLVKSLLVILPFLNTTAKATDAADLLCAPLPSVPCAGPAILEIPHLHDLPDLLEQHRQPDHRLSVFFDFDDTVARRIFQIGGQTIEYLSSPEIQRMMKPHVDPVIEEIAATRGTNLAEISSAITCLRRNHTPSYRYSPLEGSFQRNLFEPLTAMGATIKICSGLPLHSDAAKLPFILSLGLTPGDYIHAHDKGGTMLSRIFEMAEANHTVVLVDNNPDALDEFSQGAGLYSIMARARGKEVTFIPVLHTQFANSLTRGRAQIAQEIDFAMELHLAKQREMAASGIHMLPLADRPPLEFTLPVRRRPVQPHEQITGA